MMSMSRKKIQLENEIKEKTVLKSELSSLKKGAKIYQQQQNSNVYFLADKEKIFSQCKNTLDNLIEEYKEMEKMKSDEQDGEMEDETDQQ